MHVSVDSRRPLLDFVSDLINSGCSSFGPQCAFIGEVSDEHGSLIPSKCTSEFFEAKYGTRSSYAPALVDFLSSHKGFFGTGESSVLAYTCFILSEFLPNYISPQCVADTCLILESVFSDICSSIKINREDAFLDQFLKSDQGIFLPCNHGIESSSADELPGSIYPSYAQDVAALDDLDWFFEDDGGALTGSTVKSIGHEMSLTDKRQESDPKSSNLNGSSSLGSCVIERPDYVDNAADAHSSTNPGLGIGTRTFLGTRTHVCNEDVNSATNDRHTDSDLDILSDAWLAYGLQHSFKWEFEFNSAEDVDDNCGTHREPTADCTQCNQQNPLNQVDLCRHGVSLPMRLAMIAAEALWGAEKNGGKCDYCASQRSQSGSGGTVKETSLKEHIRSSSCTTDNGVPPYSRCSRNYGDCEGDGVSDGECDLRHFSSSVPHTALYVTRTHSSGSNARHTYSILESANSFSLEHGEGGGYDYHSFLEELSLDSLTVHTVTGVPTAYSDARPGSLLCSCKKDVVSKSHQIALGKQVKKRSRRVCTRTVRTSGVKDVPLILQRVAVIDTGWDTDCFDSGNMGEGTGASIQARTLNHVFVRSVVPGDPSRDGGNVVRERKDGSDVDEDEDGDRDGDGNGNRNKDSGVRVTTADQIGYETSDSLYLRDAMAQLHTLKVDAIFCPLAFCSLKLLDACLSASIVVFPLSTRDLVTVAHLSNAEVVSDLMDLDADSVGRALEVRLLPFLSVRARDSMSGSGAEREEDEVIVEFSRAIFDIKGVVLMSEGRQCERDLREGEVEGRDNADSDSYQTSDKVREFNLTSSPSDYLSNSPSNADPNSDPGPGSDSDSDSDCDTAPGNAAVRIASVVIASPTSAQTAALTDRFFRCLHRLRGVIQGAGVMPGGGIPELLVCLQLDKVIEEMSSELADYLNERQGHTEESMMSSDHSDISDGMKDSQESDEILQLEKERLKMKRAMETQRVRERDKMDLLREKIETLRAAQRALYSTIRAVSLNNGSTWLESCTALEESVRLVKGALPLSFPTATTAATATQSAHTAHPPFCEGGGGGGGGGVVGSVPGPLSVVDSLRLKSHRDICALSLFAPMIIATDHIAASTLTSNRSVSQIPAPSELHPTSCSRQETVCKKPVLDVVGVKTSSFKNSIAAIKMFMSARVIVTSD